MKKHLLLGLACLGMMSVNAQTLFEDDFADVDISDWTLVDADGDGQNWIAVQFLDDFEEPNGAPLMVSNSWNSVPLTPNNYAISPAIDLTGQNGSTPLTLSWESVGIDPDFSNEKYSVYVATANTVEAMLASTVTFTEVVTDNGPGGLNNRYTKTLDVTDFAGETIYVAFRHHDVTDQFRLGIGNVSVYVGAPVNIESHGIEGFTHMFNPQTSVLTVNAATTLSNITLYNTVGQVVLSKNLTFNQANVDLSGLGSGVYVVKVDGAGSTSSFKIALK